MQGFRESPLVRIHGAMRSKDRLLTFVNRLLLYPSIGFALHFRCWVIAWHHRITEIGNPRQTRYPVKRQGN